MTAAIGFPTTVAPLYQHGLVPVYVDVEPDTYNPSLEHARRGDRAAKTRAVVLAHTLGNPFDAPGLAELCRRARPRADRGRLRRARLARSRGRAAGTFGARRDLLVLSRPPHDHRRGRRRRRATTTPGCARWPRCASGAATAGARRASTTPAAAASRAASASCPPATTTSTSSRTSASTSRSPTCRRRSGSRSSTSSDGFHARRRAELRPPRRRAARRSRTGSCSRARCPAPTLVVRLPADAARGRRRPRRRELQRFLLERGIDSRLLLAGNLVRQPGFLGREHRVAGEPRARRPDHRGGALGRLLAGARRAAARLDRRVARPRSSPELEDSNRP